MVLRWTTHLVRGKQKGQGFGTYVSDRGGAAPKLITHGAFGWPVASPDGRRVIVIHDGKPELLTIGESAPKEIPGVMADDFVIARSDDPKIVYVATTNGTTREIERLNLDTGRRELWQAWKPKDPAGVAPPSHCSAGDNTRRQQDGLLAAQATLDALPQRQSEIADDGEIRVITGRSRVHLDVHHVKRRSGPGNAATRRPV